MGFCVWGWTTDEVKAQGGCGVAATGVARSPRIITMRPSALPIDSIGTSTASGRALAKGVDESMVKWRSMFMISQTVLLQSQNLEAFKEPPEVRRRGTSNTPLR
jgi:hypothetical protein